MALLKRTLFCVFHVRECARIERAREREILGCIVVWKLVNDTLIDVTSPFSHLVTSLAIRLQFSQNIQCRVRPIFSHDICALQ